MNKKELQKVVGCYCKDFRENTMQVDLGVLAKEFDINYKTLYSFELGLSSNIYLFYLYYSYTDKKQQFIEGLYETKKLNWETESV